MLVILTMNRNFMEFMHTEYPELTSSLADAHFGFTAVESAWPPCGLRPFLHPASASRLLVPTLLLFCCCSCCACSYALVLLSSSLRHLLVLFLRLLRAALVRTSLRPVS